MDHGSLTSLLLHRSDRGWRTTTRTTTGALLCGYLRDTPADAPFEAAAQEMEASAREFWGLDGAVAWEPTPTGSWEAVIEPPAAPRPVVDRGTGHGAAGPASTDT